MSGLASAAEGIQQDPRSTRPRWVLRILTGALAGGAVLLLWGGAAGASTQEAPQPAKASGTPGLLTGLVGQGGALTPVVDLVDGVTGGLTGTPPPPTAPAPGSGPIATTVAGVATTVDATLAPVTTPLAPVTDPVVVPVVETVGTVVSTTVDALPPVTISLPTTPSVPGVPTTPLDPTEVLPNLPLDPGTGANPTVPGTGTGTGADDGRIGGSTADPARSAAGAALAGSTSTAPRAQRLAGSLHGQRPLIARGSEAGGTVARTHGDRPLRASTLSATQPATAPTGGPAAPAHSPFASSTCAAPSTGVASGALPLCSLPSDRSRRSSPTGSVTPSSAPLQVRAPSDDPGFSPD